LRTIAAVGLPLFRINRFVLRLHGATLRACVSS
jgi:hypothetical protein